MKLTGWILVLGFALGAACVDPVLPRIPPDEEEEDDGDDGEQTGFDVRTAPPYYLV